MSDYFFYDMNKKMADLAKKQQLAEDAHAAPVKPAPNRLMEAAADYSAKKAAAGKDIGKPGKNFSKIAAGAAKKYGSAEAGKRVAGAVLNKLRHPTKEGVEPPKHYGPPGQIPSVETAKFDRYMQKRWAEHEATRPVPITPPGLPTKEGVNQSQLKPYKSTMKEGGKPDFLDLDKDGNRKEPMRSAARSAKKGLREVDATPQDTGSYEDEVKKVNAPQRKASAPVPPPKKTVPPKPKMYPPQAIDEPVQEGGAAPGGPGDYNYIKDNYQNVTLNGRIIGTTADGGKTFISSRPAEFKSGAMPQGATVDSNKQKIEPMRDYGVDEGGVPMTPKQKKFAALAKPFDKISFADKIVGAKKEVDEMLGDVAANAMKKAVRGRNRDMDETSDWSKLHEPFKAGHFDDTPTRRRSSSGGEIDTSKSGVTRHRPVKGNYSGAAHDAGADNEPTGAVGRRKVGAGMGTKIGAKINRGTSKLMTDEDMFEPQDSGEYDREGEMAKDDIKTVVRHAQALEKILGDDDNLPEWVQAKLAKIEGMMTAVDDYMQNQKSSDSDSSDTDDGEMAEERTSKRDNRAERAGRKVAKDIEYDEKRKDGIHGRRRGSEDDKAERAGRRVTKDIEYDEKKKKKKKEVDETTSSGSVATGGSAPKSGGGMKVGTGIYDSLNRQLENMISESMNINMSMNNDDHGGPKKSLTVTATDEDATMLAGLLKMAGLGHGDEHIHAMTGDDSDMDALHSMDHMHGDEPCADCGQTTCECDGMMETLATNPDGTPYVTDIDPDEHDAETARLGRAGNPPSFRTPGAAHADQGGYDVPSFRTPGAAHADQGGYDEMDEAYGDTDASENEPDWPTDEEGTDDAMMYSGGLNGPKSTGQTTVPVIAHQDDRMGSDGDHELRRMMKIAGLR